MAYSKQPIKPGVKFGKLTVVSDSGERKNNYIIWNCRCDCGNMIKVDMRTLKRGTVTDCGCVSKLKAGQRDITGQRFGMLTAQYCTGKIGTGNSYIWHCKCDCGGEIDAPLKQLTGGYRKSCGCLSNPQLKNFVGRKFGRLTVTGYAGKWGGAHHWNCVCECGSTITTTQTNLQNGHTKSCGCFSNEKLLERQKLVDGTSVANLERNLSNKLSSNNTSGHTGVYRQARTGYWIAQIGFKGKRYHLGCFYNKEDAVKARIRAEESVFGDFLDWYYSEYAADNEEISVPGALMESTEPVQARV